jgi:hypothetical protein
MPNTVQIFSLVLKLKIPVFALLIGLSGLFPIATTAQKLEFNGEFLLFREAKTKQPVLIVNDSLVYKGNAMKRIPFKHTEYPAKLQEYKFFNIGTKTYLVHEGCGPVLEFRNDSIVRIDNSFLHRNQFGAVRFVYDNEIYFYGGYGLFTFKNILTKYDFHTQEWTEIKTFSEVPLETRDSAFSYIIDNDLYIFGGKTKNETNIQTSKYLDNTVWKLHLPSMQWSCNGEINGITNFDYLGNCLNYENLDKIYLITHVVNELDPKLNTFKKTNLEFFPTFFSNYIQGNKIICVLRDEIKKNKYFAIIPVDTVKGNLISSSKLISQPKSDFKNKTIIFLFLIIVIIIFLLFRINIKEIIKPFQGIIYSQNKKGFLYKGNKILIFDEQEMRLLLFLLEQNNQFVSLNNLNQLFENNNQSESISAIVKRREATVTRLITKISKITGIEEKDLILERKNSEDKRIKDLKLLPNLLKIKN